MKVTLIESTPNALEVLLFTKQTRLNMSPGLFDEIKAWPEEKKMAELSTMLDTISSPWEFVDYIFMIEGVSRGFTHQFVRQRIGTSFAQQSQRAVDMSGFEFVAGPTVDGHENEGKDFMNRADFNHNANLRRIHYACAMASASDFYHDLLKLGANKQDARGVLPTNIQTNIAFKANLRTMSEMAAKRLCTRTQDEFQSVFLAMRDAIISVHPWAKPFMKVHCAKTGTCLFPAFPVEKCPVKFMVYNPKTTRSYGFDAKLMSAYPPGPGNLDQIEAYWEAHRTEAQP